MKKERYKNEARVVTRQSTEVEERTIYAGPSFRVGHLDGWTGMEVHFFPALNLWHEAGMPADQVREIANKSH